MKETLGGRIKELREVKRLSQRVLAKSVGVSAMAVSQWETNTTEPKISNLKLLSKFFDVNLEWLSFGQTKAINDKCFHDQIVSIPFYSNVSASAGGGVCVNDEGYIPINLSLVNAKNIKHLVCVKVSGDSMEPVLRDGSIIIIDMSDKFIKDGGIYVLRQEEMLRVKVLGYTSSGIRLKSYNIDYKDERYTFQNFERYIKIMGKVVGHISKM